MSDYQVVARKFRPQTFAEILGQDAIVITLKNAIKNNRLAHAYLFSGPRGTGKTTAARVFAKALNCINRKEDYEPCNSCTSCLEITSGHSLDVLEIDGASHRGIDDIRQINENVGYTPASGLYKIYIIDEVHMLTKEAFNALLKTLEEPPKSVKFIFATTEPHKVLPTILSRCQRFNLNRIPLEEIVAKLRNISNKLNVTIEDEALRLLAIRAEGGLRDAESLLDQIMAFNEGNVTVKTITDVLGLVEKEQFYLLDQAVKSGNTAFAFELAHYLFSNGKDLLHFIDSLIEHIRTLLLIKVSGNLSQELSSFLALSKLEREQYELSAKIYTQEQCITILEFLIEGQNQIRYMTSPKIALEALLIRMIRTLNRVPLDFLVKKLAELENKFSDFECEIPPTKTNEIKPEVKPEIKPEIKPEVKPGIKPEVKPEIKPEIKPQVKLETKKELKEISDSLAPRAIDETESLTIDPTPKPGDFGIKIAAKTSDLGIKTVPKTNSHYETLLQFAAVELEGVLKKI